MRIYNYSEARQNFATILNASLKEEVVIKRRDGSRFKVIPIRDRDAKSPFEIEGIPSDVTTEEIMDIIGEGRRYEKA